MKQKNRHNRSFLTVCGLSLVLSCLVSAEARADKDADMQAVREYRLTDERVEEFTQASRNLISALEADSGLAADDGPSTSTATPRSRKSPPASTRNPPSARLSNRPG